MTTASLHELVLCAQLGEKERFSAQLALVLVGLNAKGTDALKELDCLDDTGLSLMHHLILQNEIDLLQTLIGVGADVNTRESRLQQTALLFALCRGNISVAKVILGVKSKLIDVSDIDNVGRSALHYAALKGDPEIIETLLSMGANSDQPDDQGWTPLHLAVSAGRVAAVKALKKSNINACNELGYTPLHVSVALQKDDIAELLATRLGANPNICATDGDSPLHLAVRRPAPEVLKMLISQDGDVSRANAVGITVSDIAMDSSSLSHTLSECSSEVETYGPNCCVVDEIASLNCKRTLWFILQAKDRFARRRTRGGDAVEVRITHADSPEKPCPCRTKDMENGTYRVLWRTNSSGHHNVSIKVHGKHVRGSPFGVDVHEREPVVAPEIDQHVSPYQTNDSVASPIVIGSKKRKAKTNKKPFKVESADSPAKAMSMPLLSDTVADSASSKDAASSPLLLPPQPQNRKRSGSSASNSSSGRGTRESRGRSATAVEGSPSVPTLPRMTSTYLPIGKLQSSTDKDSDSERSLAVITPISASSAPKSSGRVSDKVEELRSLRAQLDDANRLISSYESQKNEMAIEMEALRQKMSTLAKFTQRERSKTKCMLCANPRDTYFLPCKHMPVCQECASARDSCPHCDSLVSSRVTINLTY